jgi:predicted RNase H-like nuclease (RuvC/YqgF family)
MKKSRKIMNDNKIYDRNNINDIVIPIVNNNNVAQQNTIISRIRELQDIIKGMNENIRQYNLKIVHKNEEKYDLIEERNDNSYSYKQQKIIKEKIQNNEDEVDRIRKLILKEQSKIDEVNMELDYQIKRLNM